MKFMPSLALAMLMRMESSVRHFSRTAFTSPIPRMRWSSSKVTSYRPRSPSLGYLARLMTSSATCITLLSLVPVRRMMANNSISVRFSGPNRRNFS